MSTVSSRRSFIRPRGWPGRTAGNEIADSDGLHFLVASSEFSPFVVAPRIEKEIDAMKVPITLSKFCTYAFTSALFVLLFAMLTHLLEMSRRPTTIEQFLLLFVLQFGTSIAVDFYRNWKKKSPTPPEAR